MNNKHMHRPWERFYIDFGVCTSKRIENNPEERLTVRLKGKSSNCELQNDDFG